MQSYFIVQGFQTLEIYKNWLLIIHITISTVFCRNRVIVICQIQRCNLFGTGTRIKNISSKIFILRTRFPRAFCWINLLTCVRNMWQHTTLTVVLKITKNITRVQCYLKFYYIKDSCSEENSFTKLSIFSCRFQEVFCSWFIARRLCSTLANTSFVAVVYSGYLVNHLCDDLHIVSCEFYVFFNLHYKDIVLVYLIIIIVCYYLCSTNNHKR